MISEISLQIVNCIAHCELIVHRNDEVLAYVTSIKFSTKLKYLHASRIYSDVLASNIVNLIVSWSALSR